MLLKGEALSFLVEGDLSVIHGAVHACRVVAEYASDNDRSDMAKEADQVAVDSNVSELPHAACCHQEDRREGQNAVNDKVEKIDDGPVR